MTTLGRPESFRTAYQAALHDLAQMTAERDALRADLAHYQAFVAITSHGFRPKHMASGHITVECLGCTHWTFLSPDSTEHNPGCIVAEARQAQKEASHD